MPFALLKYGLSSKYPAKRHFPKATELKPSYDVVIIGGGGHGLAAAYYLARDYGITNVAVLDKGYLAGGNTARNTAIIRSNYLTPEGVRFYDESRAALSATCRRTSTTTSSIPSAAISPWPIPTPPCAPAAGAPRSTSIWASIPS